MKYCPQCGTELAERQMDGVQRRACASPSCTFVHWDNPVPVVAGVVRWRDKFVLARNVAWPPGIFSMITGFVERNETPELTLAREMKEELGLDLAESIFIGHYLFSEANQLLVAFLAEGEGSLLPGSEIAETRVLSDSELAAFDFGGLKLASRIVSAGRKLASIRALNADGRLARAD